MGWAPPAADQDSGGQHKQRAAEKKHVSTLQKDCNNTHEECSLCWTEQSRQTLCRRKIAQQTRRAPSRFTGEKSRAHFSINTQTARIRRAPLRSTATPTATATATETETTQSDDAHRSCVARKRQGSPRIGMSYIGRGKGNTRTYTHPTPKITAKILSRISFLGSQVDTACSLT